VPDNGKVRIVYNCQLLDFQLAWEITPNLQLRRYGRSPDRSVGDENECYKCKNLSLSSLLDVKVQNMNTKKFLYKNYLSGLQSDSDSPNSIIFFNCSLEIFVDKISLGLIPPFCIELVAGS